MKPIIGIITRPLASEENHKMFGVYEEISSAVVLAGGIPVGIIPETSVSKETLQGIDGIIFQGGDEFTEYERRILEIAYRDNIKTLGICLGMQLMGVYFDGNLLDIVDHKCKNKNYVHMVKIKKDSTLYKIFGKNSILVNSRHKSALSNTSLDIIGRSDDGVIEAIEDKTKDFFVGVQWHPESMITYDNIQNQLFSYFINKCRK